MQLISEPQPLLGEGKRRLRPIFAPQQGRGGAGWLREPRQSHALEQRAPAVGVRAMFGLPAQHRAIRASFQLRAEYQAQVAADRGHLLVVDQVGPAKDQTDGR